MKTLWRHKGITLLGLVLAICVVFNPRSVAGKPSAENCATLQVASNGFHTNFYLPAHVFSEASTLRQAWPTASWFVIGWGDESFYRDGPTLARSIAAIIPPSPTVLHVIATPDTPETYFLDEAVTVALSTEGMDEVARLIEARFARTEDDEPIRLADGHYPGASAFYRAKGSYHAFHTCNQWLAGVLRRAGVSINAPSAIPAQSVMWQLKLRAPKACLAA
ncbi:MAG: DUF2459 domain-containing protein [Henriciella sp.]|nr:DUF2459 domain-containing protein [Henriciella sp.]